MNELDMSRPGSELFAEPTQQQQYNSYNDVMVQGQVVEDPLDMGVTQSFESAQQGQPSDKEMNFRALREEASKLKEQSEYWRGQAEALSKTNKQPEREPEVNPYDKLDWDDAADVRKAFNALRSENESMRAEFHDSLAAVQTKSKHQDWQNMVTTNVPELTNKNPLFAEMIKNASNPYEAAYLLAELNANARGTQQPTQPVNAPVSDYGQRAMTNAQKPRSLDSMGGQSKLSAADYYANMSDEDFGKIASKNMAGV